MARYVPLAKRRDLGHPAYLRLDTEARFPDLTVQPTAHGKDVFGPFRDARAAIRARDALYKHFRLRPCDFDFKPPTDLPDGLAAGLARALEGAAGIAEIPAWVARADGRSIVGERGRDGLELYPIAGGRVIDGARVGIPMDALEEAVGGLAWTPAAAGDDTPWLNAWRHGKRSGVEIPVAPGETSSTTAARIRDRLAGDVPTPSR